MQADLQKYFDAKSVTKKTENDYRRYVSKYYGKSEDEVIELVKDLKNSLKLTSIKPLIAFRKFHGQPFEKLQSYREETDKVKKDADTSESGEDNNTTVDVEDMKQKVLEISDDNFEDILKKTIFHVILNETFNLRTDICTLKYKNFDIETDNFYSDGKFTFNKIQKKSGKESYNITDATKKYITALLENSDSNKYDYLFPMLQSNKNLQKDLQNAFSKYVKKNSNDIFGQPLTVNSFRHIYATSKNNDIEKEVVDGVITLSDAIEKTLKVSESMKHNIKTHVENYVNKDITCVTTTETSEQEYEQKPAETLDDDQEKPIDSLDIDRKPTDIVCTTTPNINVVKKLTETKDTKDISTQTDEPITRTVIINGIEITVNVGEDIFINDTKFTF